MYIYVPINDRFLSISAFFKNSSHKGFDWPGAIADARYHALGLNLQSQDWKESIQTTQQNLC